MHIPDPEGRSDEPNMVWRSDNTLFSTGKPERKVMAPKEWDFLKDDLIIPGGSSGDFIMNSTDAAVTASSVRKCRVCQRPGWRDHFGGADDKGYKKQRDICHSCLDRRIIKPRTEWEGITGGEAAAETGPGPLDWQWNRGGISSLLSSGATQSSPNSKAKGKHVQSFLEMLFD
jgi:hypothetical protein